MTDTSIVVTGMGVVTPAGCTLDALWDRLVAGDSTAATLDDPRFDGLPVRFGCRVQGLDGCDHVTAAEAETLDDHAVYALTAALAAYEDAGSPAPDPHRAAVVVGNGTGGQVSLEQQSLGYLTDGPAGVGDEVAKMLPYAANQIATRLGWRGPSLTISTACASGGYAIGEAMQLLRAGRVDVVLAGGAEATLTPYVLAAFTNLQALSRRVGDPGGASRPFDADRDGFVMGEGAAFVVLERHHDARARSATPYATLAGYAATTDAYHLVMPSPQGTGAAQCITAALTDAHLAPRDIVHINAHGTSTPLNDRAEAHALHTVFGPHPPPVTANKGTLGHLIGAAAATELIATILTLHHHTIPPTANHHHPDPDTHLDIVHTHPRPLTPGPTLTNAFGFGGHNACHIITPN